MSTATKRQENRVRKLANRLGYRVEKSRQREHANNRGHFRLIQNHPNILVMGQNYDATLDAIQGYLSERKDR